MTNSERIAAANTRLSALVETAESLPDAGTGGGGVETCTVTIVEPQSGVSLLLYITRNYENGVFSAKIWDTRKETITYPFILENVPRNSLIVMEYSQRAYKPTITGGVEFMGNGTYGEMVYLVTSDGTVGGAHTSYS